MIRCVLITYAPQNGWTALHLAAEQGHYDVVLVLLNCDADSTITNKVSPSTSALAIGAHCALHAQDGDTALACAQKKGRDQIVQLFADAAE